MLERIEHLKSFDAAAAAAAVPGGKGNYEFKIKLHSSIKMWSSAVISSLQTAGVWSIFSGAVLQTEKSCIFKKVKALEYDS